MSDVLTKLTLLGEAARVSTLTSYTTAASWVAGKHAGVGAGVCETTPTRARALG